MILFQVTAKNVGDGFSMEHGVVSVCLCELVILLSPTRTAELTRCHLGVDSWAQRTMYEMRCTWTPSGKYDRMIQNVVMWAVAIITVGTCYIYSMSAVLYHIWVSRSLLLLPAWVCTSYDCLDF